MDLKAAVRERSLSEQFRAVESAGECSQVAGASSLKETKNREAGFGPASYRLAETFSLKVTVLTPATTAVSAHSIQNSKFVNPRNLASSIECQPRTPVFHSRSRFSPRKDEAASLG
jgi:hypothetical protein